MFEDSEICGVSVRNWVRAFLAGGYRKELQEFEELTKNPPPHFANMFGDLYPSDPMDTLKLRIIGQRKPWTGILQRGSDVLVFPVRLAAVIDSQFSDWKHSWCKFPITEEELLAMGDDSDEMDGFLDDQEVVFAISWSGTPPPLQWEVARFVCMITIYNVYVKLQDKLGSVSRMLSIPAPFVSITKP